MELFGTMICFSHTVLDRVSVASRRQGRDGQGLPEVQEAGGHGVVFGLFVLALSDLGDFVRRLAGTLEQRRPRDARVGLRGPFRVRGIAMVRVLGRHVGGVWCAYSSGLLQDRSYWSSSQVSRARLLQKVEHSNAASRTASGSDTKIEGGRRDRDIFGRLCLLIAQ